MQLPDTQEPTTLWPSAQWKDVSEQYAGLFFRVLGNGSQHFDSVQNEGYKKLELFSIEEDIKPFNSIPHYDTNIKYGHEYNHIIEPIIPKGIFNKRNPWILHQFDSLRSKQNKDFHYYYFKIKFNDNEVRPKNTAIKVWQRIA